MQGAKSRWAKVFSVIKVLIAAVIAVALVKFAFFPNNPDADAAAGLDPTADFGAVTVQPEKASIKNSLKLEGTIENDPASSVKTGLGGEVAQVYVADGQAVNAGDSILLMKKEMPGQDTVTKDADGNETVVPGKPWFKQEWVQAPVAGTVELDALVSQQFGVGDVVAKVQPATFSAVASVTPDQMYRMQQVPASAEVTIKDGPAPFACTGLTIKAGQAQSAAKKGDSGGEGGTAIQARCAIPGEQRVFPGLQVKMAVVAGEANDVLTLPVTAVEGRFQNGYVYVPSKNPKKPKKIAVELGMTDGSRIEIKSGLKAKQKVLEFVPGTGDTAMQCDPVTGEGC